MGMSPKLLRPRASGFDPRSISGLALWLDAADTSSLYTTDAGPVTAVSAPTEISGCVGWWDASDAASITQSGGLVSQWNDKSGQGNHATASGTARPTATASGLNGLQVLTFNGSSAGMGITGTSRTNETLFVVGRANAAAAGTVKTHYFLSDSSSGFGLAAVLKSDGASGGIEINLGGFTTGTTRASFVVANAQPYGPGLLSVVRSAASGGTLLNAGVSQATCTTSNAFAVSRIGSVGSFFLDGYIAEAIIFNTALSTTDRARVEAYLAAKWGIAGVHAQATATSDPVGYWRDKSGNNRHATQATGASRPTVSGTALNGRKQLGLVSQHLRGPSASWNGSVTAYWVGRTGQATAGAFVFHDGEPDQSSAFHAGWLNNQGVGAYGNGWGSGNAPRAESPSALRSADIVAGVTLSSTEAIARANGATVNTVAALTGTLSQSTPASFYIGREASGTWTNVNGTLAELIIYQPALNVSQRQRLERYLAAKWGITLAPQVSNADAQDWVNRVYANGGTVSSTTATAVNTFCNAIDAAGIRDRFYRLNLLCGTSDASLIAVRTPLYRGPSLAGTQYGNTLDANVNLVAATDYVETGATGGLTGTGNNGVGAGSTKYLNTGLTPTTIGVNSFHVSAYIYGLNQTGPSQSSPIGIRDNSAPANRWGFDYRQTSMQWHAGGNLSNTIATPSVTAYRQYIATRSSAAAASVYSNGALAATDPTDVSASLQSRNLNFFVLAQNTDTVPAAYFPYRMGGYSLGISMNDSQAAAFHAAMLAFSQTMGRQ